MKMLEIRREVVDLPDESELAVVLADEAETVLGYSLMKESITKADGEDKKELSRTLRSLDISILKMSDVLEYQLEQLHELTASLCEKWIARNEGVATWDRFQGPAWVMTKIEEYKQPIPSFVINKAVQIKRAMPDCGIFISHLEQHPDPFLIVRSTREKTYSWGTADEKIEEYAVDVWAEPKFEARM